MPITDASQQSVQQLVPAPDLAVALQSADTGAPPPLPPPPLDVVVSVQPAISGTDVSAPTAPSGAHVDVNLQNVPQALPGNGANQQGNGFVQ